MLKDIVHGGVGTLDEIAIFFGARVADLVAEVTDDMSLTREQRMDDQVLLFILKNWCKHVATLFFMSVHIGFVFFAKWSLREWKLQECE